MGYKIRVDHSTLTAAANEIETYNQKMSKKMSNANNVISQMMTAWRGQDANAYKTKWDSVNDRNSTYGKMKKSMDNYMNYLKDSANRYKRAQTDAINRANMLPRW